MLHQHGNHARSKVDYYLQHLFMRVLRHTLGSDEDEDDEKRKMIAPSITRLPRSSSPVRMYADEDESLDSWKWSEDKTLPGSKFSTKRMGLLRSARADLERGQQQAPQRRVAISRSMRFVIIFRLTQDYLLFTGSFFFLFQHRKHAAEVMTIEQLKRGERVNVDVIPFFIFLLKDGKAE